MTDTAPLGFPEAARRLGVPVRVLRRAIRAGRLPAPSPTSAGSSAVAALPPEWVDQAGAAVAAAPDTLRRTATQKVPPFARYEGTSVWRKYPNRVREHAKFHATAAHALRPTATTPA